MRITPGQALLGEEHQRDHLGDAPQEVPLGDAHPAVVRLAQPAIPLPGNPRRGFALLGKAALVNHQSRAASPEVRIGVGHQLPEHAGAIPGGFARHVTQSPRVAARDDVRHAFHVGPSGSVESAQVRLGCLGDRARRGFKAGDAGGKMAVQIGLDIRRRRENAIDIFESAWLASTQ